jgi:hypothetical protein
LANSAPHIIAAGEMPHAEKPKKTEEHATGWSQQDTLIVGGWVAFTALCLGLRKLRSRHESH